MKKYNCITLNNHLYHLKNAINEPDNTLSSRYFKSIIGFYKSQLKRKNCSFFKILIEYCEMWKSIKNISFIDDRNPIIKNKLKRRFKKCYYIDPNFKRIDPFIDFEFEFQLYKGLKKFIKAHYSKDLAKSFKLLNESKNIFESISKNKTSKEITKQHVFLEKIPVFIDIIDKNFEILHYFTYTSSIKKNKYQNILSNQIKGLIHLKNNNQNFQYLDYLLLVERLINFNKYLKECKERIISKEKIKKFPLQSNFPLCYDMDIKILIDSFNTFNPKNIKHLTFFIEKLYQLFKHKSKKIPLLIFIQLKAIFDMILIIRSNIKILSTNGCDMASEWNIITTKDFDIELSKLTID